MIHNLVSHFTLNKFASGESGGRFQCTALFIDISGFSTVTSTLMQHGQHGAEVLAGVMRTIFEPLVRSVYEHGGFIATLAGDAFTALFPGEEVTDALRSLAAAWRMQSHMAANANQSTPYGEFIFAAKVGLACGETTWGILTSENRTRATDYFQGAAIDGCAAAEHLAGSGEIILSSDLYTRLLGWVEVIPAADHYRLTGINSPLPSPQAIALPPPDLESMARFFPRSLLDQEFSGEFRHIVNVFISLPTVRTEAQLIIFMRSFFALQDQYGGLLNRLDFGDKGTNLLLFWGVPTSYENDIDRALNFVLGLQTQTSIPLHAGITYRIAHAGFIGSALREEYTCFGQGVNLAARYMMAAPRGEIWVDVEVAKRAEGKFEVEFEGEMGFKGFSEKQPVYAVLEHKEETEAFFRGKMVGRQAELARLREFVAPLWDGQYAGTLVVWGEAGLGKSRLVYAFQHSDLFETPEVLWALCQTDQILQTSLNPFRYWLRYYFNQSHTQSEARNKRSFNHQLDNLIDQTDNPAMAQELDRTRSFLGALVDLYWPDSLYEQLDPKGRFENTLEGLKVLIKAESLRQPLILYLEDATWLETDTITFLQQLTRHLRTGSAAYPIALLLTSRPEPSLAEPGRGHGLLGEEVTYQEIDLAHFSRKDLGYLAEDVLGGPVAPALVELLVNRAEGNPFFAEQTLLYLKEQELLSRDRRGTFAITSLPERELPTDVRTLLVARLDRLTQEVKMVVQTAAVLGREFEVQLLAQMLRDDNNLQQKVRQAQDATIWFALSELRYMFKHLLLRDAAYTMQLRARRQELHKLAAEGIETLYAVDLAPHYGELAYHYDQSGLADQACLYLEKAGERARAQGAPMEARRFFDRALELLPSEDREARWRILLGRDEVLGVLGETEARKIDDRRLVALAQEMGDDRRLAEAYYRQAYAFSMIGQYRLAMEVNDLAVATARRAGDRKMEALALGLKVIYLSTLGEMQAASATADEALACAQEVGDDETLARTLHNVATHYIDAGDLSRALHLHNQEVEIIQRLRNLKVEVFGLANIGYIYIMLGLPDVGRARLERSLELAETTGNRPASALDCLNLGLAYYRSGEYLAAQEIVETTLPVFSEIGDIYNQGFCYSYLGHVLEKLGDLMSAIRSFEQARRLFDQIGARGYNCDALAGLARCLLAQGQIAEALQHTDVVWDYLQTSSQGMEFPILAYQTCADVFDKSGASEKAAMALQAGFRTLMERADKISDPTWRKSFLENVPEHRAIVEKWNQVFPN